MLVGRLTAPLRGILTRLRAHAVAVSLVAVALVAAFVALWFLVLDKAVPVYAIER